MRPLRRIRPGLRPLAPLLAVLAAGCATPNYGPPINGDRALSPEEMRLQAVETKLADLTRRFNSSEASQGQQYQSDLGQLHGAVEQLQHDFAANQKQMQDQLTALDARVRLLEARQAGIAGPGAAPGGVPPASTAPGAYAPPPVPGVAPAGAPPATNPPVSSAADEEAMYLRSFDLLKAQKYDDAIRSFKEMLAKYPNGNYADNAWYWTGQAYYIKQDASNALTAFNAVLDKFPASPKVPDAMLGTGIIQQDQGKTSAARAVYQRVLKDYPTSNAAAQARTRLAKLH